MGLIGHIKNGKRENFRIHEMEKLLTPEKLCEILEIEKSTLYSWTSKEQIPFMKINGMLRFSEGEIVKWLKLKERGDIVIKMAGEVLETD